MYNYYDTGNGIISIIFFILVVLLGAFFTMNLVLAIIVDSFSAANAEEPEELEETDAAIIESLEGSRQESIAGESVDKPQQQADHI